MALVARGGGGSASSSTDDDACARHLLSRKFYLAALELHQELLEGNNGVHSVGALNSFFGDAGNYASLVRRVVEEESRSRKDGAWGWGAKEVVRRCTAVVSRRPAGRLDCLSWVRLDTSRPLLTFITRVLSHQLSHQPHRTAPRHPTAPPSIHNLCV